MTPSKLHPAAVRAAEKHDRVCAFNIAQLVSAAIDDHLKSEGWEELREAAGKLAKAILGRSMTPLKVDWLVEELGIALRRVRGEKP